MEQPIFHIQALGACCNCRGQVKLDENIIALDHIIRHLLSYCMKQTNKKSSINLADRNVPKLLHF